MTEILQEFYSMVNLPAIYDGVQSRKAFRSVNPED